MARIQTETGFRNVQIDTYRDRKIEVVTGWDCVSDRWPVHVYVFSPDGCTKKKVEGQWFADSEGEAFDGGFAIGKQQIDVDTE